jgi:hypothetical protein
VNIDRGNRLIIHIDIPDFQCEIISSKNVPAILAKLDIRDRCNDFGKERLCRRVFHIFIYCIEEAFVIGDLTKQRGRTSAADIATYIWRVDHTMMQLSCHSI